MIHFVIKNKVIYVGISRFSATECDVGHAHSYTVRNNVMLDTHTHTLHSLLGHSMLSGLLSQIYIYNGYQQSGATPKLWIKGQM